MKKVLITASTFPRWGGDTEPRFVLDFAKEISKEYDVTVLTPWSEGAEETEVLEGVNVIRYHYFPIKKCETLCAPGSVISRIKEKKSRVLLVPFLVLALFFKLLFSLKEYDFVVCHWIIPQGLVQSLFKKPYMIVCHGSDVRAMNNALIKKMKIYALKKAKVVTVVSNELKLQVQQLFGVSEVLVHPMGVDVSKFKNDKDRARLNKERTVLFVGRLDKIKGVPYLIEAMKDIDAKLVIVGDGALREELEKQAEPFGEKITFLGAVEHAKLPEIYRNADVFVAPSITLENGATEGFGLVFVEAMAAGLPVIGTATGGIKDIIDDGVNGYLIEEKSSREIVEKINYLFKNTDVYIELANGAKVKAEKYDWVNVGNEYIKIINEE